MTAGPIRDVVVAGGGIVGWSAAAALKRRLPSLNVTVLPLAPGPQALADRIVSTLPSILGFHADLGLKEEDAVLRTGSSFRLGTLFRGWTGGLPDYVHAYGRHGRPFGTASFHQHWARAALAGTAGPLDLYSPAAALARAGRFAPPAADPEHIFAGFEYGLRIRPDLYENMLRAFARHLGVTVRDGALAGVRLRSADGFIEALALDDGSELKADLFVDCTGPAARLRSALDERRDDWTGWFRCDRILFGAAPAEPDLSPLDRAEAVSAGWRWAAPALGQTSHGIVYASAHMGEDEAARALETAGAVPETAPVAIAAGSRPEPWLRNCVAAGEAATVVEPLEWTNLHLAHSVIDRIVSMMPDRDCAPVERAEFNRQCTAEAERVRDFLLLHYAASGREEPFWHDAAAVDLPPSLAHTIGLFRQRGRLPFYEEETFAKDSWLAVLTGQGVVPRAVDPLIEPVPFEQTKAAMALYRDAIAAAVAAAPPHALFLQTRMRQIAR